MLFASYVVVFKGFGVSFGVFLKTPNQGKVEGLTSNFCERFARIFAQGQAINGRFVRKTSFFL